MLVAVLLFVGCADNSSYHDAKIETVRFERLHETGEIEFDLTYSGPSEFWLTGVTVEVTIWTYPEAGGDLGAGTNLPARSRSRHRIEFKTPQRKRRVVLKVQEPAPADGKAPRPFVEAWVQLVGMGYRSGN